MSSPESTSKPSSSQPPPSSIAAAVVVDAVQFQASLALANYIVNLLFYGGLVYFWRYAEKRASFTERVGKLLMLWVFGAIMFVPIVKQVMSDVLYNMIGDKLAA